MRRSKRRFRRSSEINQVRRRKSQYMDNTCLYSQMRLILNQNIQFQSHYPPNKCMYNLKRLNSLNQNITFQNPNRSFSCLQKSHGRKFNRL